MPSDVEKFMALEKKHKELDTKKIRLEEQFKAKKESLTELVKEIKSEGYDPNNLKNIIKEKEAELAKELKSFEESLEKASEALSIIEA